MVSTTMITMMTMMMMLVMTMTMMMMAMMTMMMKAAILPTGCGCSAGRLGALNHRRREGRATQTEDNHDDHDDDLDDDPDDDPDNDHDLHDHGNGDHGL